MKALKEFFGSVFNVLVIIVALVVGYYIWKNIMGNPINFEGGNPKGHPLEGNFLGMVYKGGFIVPILMAIVLTVVTFVIERFISLTRASGRGRTSKFLRNIQALMNEGRVEEASAACDKQKGSLANVIKAGLYRYNELQQDKTLPNDQKVLALQKDFEEATALELPIDRKSVV